MTGDSQLGWFHVNGNTYGTWLPGDPRGWRARHHREHVEGDYRHPPDPGIGDELHRRSRGLMNRPPVFLTPHQRMIAGQALVDKLLGEKVLLLALAVTRIHFHVLGKFPKHQVRQMVGRAKKHSAFELRAHGVAGGVWAVRCRPLPVTTRSHQLNVFHYILDHTHEGGWIWDFRAHRGK